MFVRQLRIAASLLAVCLAVSWVLGCRTTSEPKVQAPAAGQASADAAQSACERFTTRLCSELGPRTEACASLRSVRAWYSEAACQVALADVDGALERVRGLRADCDALTQKICAELGEQSPVCEEVKRDLPQVPVGHCPKLLEQHPNIMAELREREQRSQPLSAEAWASLLAGSPASLGPDDAKVTIVAFSDFQCPYCAQAHDAVHEIRERYPEQVRVIFRHFPLAFHEHARLAAKASLAAHAQGKFWPFHDRLFAHQNALDRKSLEGYAQELGLDVSAFKKGLDDDQFEPQLEADLALGRSVHVDGTPTMFVNGKRADNATEFDAVAPLIEAALAK